MWKRRGRSSALDRAQALLSAKRTSRGDAQGSTPDFTVKAQGSSGGSFKNRPAPPITHTLLSDLSELSSDSTASDHRGDDDRSAKDGNKYEEKLDSDKSSLGGGSRFLKKVSSTSNSQSSVGRKQPEQVLEPRYVSSSPSRKPFLKQARQRTNLTADLVLSPPAATQSTGGSTEQSRGGNHLRKKKADVVAERSRVSPAVFSRSKHVGVRSRAGDPLQHSGGLEVKSGRVMSTVDLESDEEDMRKLLGDSVDLSDNSFLEAQRPSSTKRLDKMLSHGSPRVRSAASPAALHPSSPSNKALPRSPDSPSHRSSPFRFTGQAQAHFSPSVLSPSPSPPLLLPSPPKRPGSSLKAESPQRSLSASSEQGEVLSLEELFPGGPDSKDPQSETSSVPAEDFKINVMTVDELVPAFDGFSVETAGKQTNTAVSDPGLPNQQVPQEEDQEVLDYQSDFESDSSTSQVSEHLPGDEEGKDLPSDVSVKVSYPDKREDDHCCALLDRSLSSTSWSSDGTYRSASSSRRSKSSKLHGSSDTPQRWRRRASARKAVKDSATQTQPDPLSAPWSAGMATVDPTVAMIYMNPAPAVTRALGADRLEAISTFDPSVFALNEILKQQLAVTRQFMDSSHHLHCCLVQSLEPPNYRYTMLEDTVQNIQKHRSPKVTMENTS
ncbi:uncharacterized protein C19orf44 homolog isoform X1 [Melanotaenia boesemani]|uniref:uncharacterized protein C19orf44 homolog isoform X1 n=1 Tax=Melanotaenia boesemani TaxID=1250792 RepID=UPI001C049B0F|nr:uncharacterized protein C19orf44 homolog isoform X1 [Melanotaenia boesemani]